MTEDELIDWHDAICQTHKGRSQLDLFDELGVDHIISGISVVRAEERVHYWAQELGKTTEMCIGALWRDGFIQGMLYAKEKA